MKNKILFFVFISLLMLSLSVSSIINAQNAFNRDSIIISAKELINESHYCALVTVDSTGQPQVRTMNPFPANDELIIWFGTTRYSRKVKEIMNNPKVSVYFANHDSATGYVNITGNAVVIDDKELLFKMKREYWASIPNWQSNFVLIKIIPKTIEVINYKHRLFNDPKTFKAPTILY
ncbi:MAG: pyridoxamine 5'-phosphate oxidase family protein [Bacteroidales bacterium]